MRQINEHEIRPFWFCNVLYDIDKMHRRAKMAKEYGFQVAGSIMYVQSPVHTDEYFADKAGQMAASPGIDTILLNDTAGVLEKERLQTLIPAIKAKINGKPLEFHANNILGMYGKAYLDAVDLGVNILHTESRSLANGPSVSSMESVVKNLEILGHTPSLDKTLFIVTVLYPADGPIDTGCCRDSHLPLVRRLPEPMGMRELGDWEPREMDPDAPFQLVAELRFDNAETGLAALGVHGPETRADIANFTAAVPVILTGSHKTG